jgi:hypothetical protein
MNAFHINNAPKQRCFTQNCGRCGAAMTCDLELGKSTCWCFSVDPVPVSEDDFGKECVCRDCLSKTLKASKEY